MTAPFIKLAAVSTQAATAAEEYEENIRVNLKRGLTRLHHMPEFRRDKGEIDIAIVGGGPSVVNFVEELRTYKYVFAAGSAHDWVISKGVIPRYAALCDPSPIMAEYIKAPCRETTYLVSTHTNEAVFKALEGMPIALWNCLPVRDGFLDEVDPGWQGIGGGCTVGLRSINLAIMLGFRNLHLYGFDSSLGEADEHHAYDFATSEEEIGAVYIIKGGFDSTGAVGPAFRCSGYQVAQANHFQEFLRHYGSLCNIKVFGEGLLPTLYRQIEARAAELKGIENVV